MKIVIEDIVVEANVYGLLRNERITIEIDTDRMGDVARRVLLSNAGEATWANRGIRAFLQEVE